MTPSDGGADGVRQIAKNASYLLLAYVVPRLFTVVSVVVAARWLGTEDFGAYGAAAALAVIASVIASLGMLPLLVREIAQAPDRARAVLSGAHRIKAVSGLAMLASTWVAADMLFADRPDARAAALVLALGWVAHAFAENVAAYYQAIERMGRWTQASALFGIVSAVVGVTLLLSTGSVAWYCAGFVAGWCVALVWLIAGLPGEARGSARRASAVPGLLREVGPFAGAFVFLTVYCKIDVLLLEAWSTPHEVGLYTAAYKSIDIFQALVIVAAGAVYPRLSRAATRPGGGSRASRTSTEILLLGALPVGLGLHLAAGPVVLLLFGSGYAGATVVLTRLALLMPMLSLTILGGYVLGAAGRMKPVAGLYAAGVTVNVALNAMLVPANGAAGAALARLGSESLLLIGFLLVLRAELGAVPRPRVALVAAAALASTALLRLVPDSTGGVLRAAGAVLAVGLIYWVGRVARGSDILQVGRAVLGGRPAPASRRAA